MSDTDKPSDSFLDFDNKKPIDLSSDELFSIIDSVDMETAKRESTHEEIFDEFNDNTLPPLQTVTGGKKYIEGKIAELRINDFDVDITNNHTSFKNQTRNNSMNEQNALNISHEKSAKENKKKMESCLISKTDIRITKNDLANAKVIKHPSQKMKNIYISEKVIAKLAKDFTNDFIDKKFSPVKIQQEEIDSLFSSKHSVHTNISILDILMSNSKLFIKNLSFINTYESFSTYLSNKLLSYFYINGFYLIIDHNSKPLEVNFSDEISSYVDNIAAQTYMNNDEFYRIVHARSFNVPFDDVYIYPYVVNAKLHGIFAFKVLEQNEIIHNAYFFDFLNVIIPFIMNIAAKLKQSSLNQNKSIVEFTKGIKSIYSYTILNFSKIFSNKLVNIEKLIREYELILDNHSLYNINYKQFLSASKLTITQELENLFKKYNISIKPSIREKLIVERDFNILYSLFLHI